MKLLCAQVVKDILDEGIDYDKVAKLTSDAKFESGDIKASVAVLSFILSSAAKHDVDSESLSSELQQLGLPKEHTTGLCKSYEDKHTVLQEKLKESSLRLGHLEAVNWRVDFTLSSSELKEVNEPIVQLKLQAQDPESGSTETTVVSITADKFRVLLTGLRAGLSVLVELMGIRKPGGVISNCKVPQGPMPEGPELHLASVFVNTACAGVIFTGAVEKSEVSKGAEVSFSSDAYRISGTSRGKEVRLTLTPIKTKKSGLNQLPMDVVFRFGMSGYFRFTAASELPKHAHLRFYTKEEPQRVLSFVDVRRFGSWHADGDWQKDRGPCVMTEYESFRWGGVHLRKLLK
ncbi:COMM domain-containing protein 4-like [Clarias magur]|uniref:COMM domain-containing protein 4-like n=1 Tax=Clarias magur TaxID=1594786 RepID=A0A8J4X597_CLAMG|nr:COMM domain-containing protein 4-like [Clarias magur]